MSNKNNVNKDFYTIAGRDRPDDNARRRTEARSRLTERGLSHGVSVPNFIPGAAPVGEVSAKAHGEPRPGRDVDERPEHDRRDRRGDREPAGARSPRRGRTEAPRKRRTATTRDAATRTATSGRRKTGTRGAATTKRRSTRRAATRKTTRRAASSRSRPRASRRRKAS